MKITFYFNYLNHHQVFVADEMYRLLGDDFRFVATYQFDASQLKGGKDYSNRPYLISFWNSDIDKQHSLELIETSDICVFGAGNLDLVRKRVQTGKLSFEVGERWLKRGRINIFSPRLIKWWFLYQTKLKNKPFYKLCASSFTAKDDRLLGCYINKHYKWGYFTHVEENDVEAVQDVSTSNITPLMWCSRYLMLKHPELPILMAHSLKDRGYHFVLDMFGCGEYEEHAKQLVKQLGVEDVVKFRGAMPNEQLMKEMEKHDIFLFTSDRNEGWGAVVNESMANGCVLVASDAIGSVPYLVKQGVNGLVFHSAATNTSFGNPDKKALDDLTKKVAWLLDNPETMKKMAFNAFNTMRDVWSPRNAAKNFLLLIEKLQGNSEIVIEKGPCSLA